MEPEHLMVNWQKHNVDDSLLTTVGSLLEDETYTVHVLAFTSVGDGPLSDPIQESIVKYELLFREGDHGREVGRTFDPATAFVVDDLKPNTEYAFRLAARSPQGLGAFTSVVRQRILQFKLSAPPQDVKCVSTRSTAILLSWPPPTLETHNGALVSYKRPLPTAGLGGPATQGGERHPPDHHSDPAGGTGQVDGVPHHDCHSYRGGTRARELDRGHPHQRERAQPAAVEGGGGGAQRHGHPRAVALTLARPAAWPDPRLPGPLCAHGGRRGMPRMVITNLQPETTYSITVAANTMKGDGARSKSKVVVTKGAVLGCPTLSVQQTPEGSLLARWEPPAGTTEDQGSVRIGAPVRVGAQPRGRAQLGSRFRQGRKSAQTPLSQPRPTDPVQWAHTGRGWPHHQKAHHAPQAQHLLQLRADQPRQQPGRSPADSHAWTAFNLLSGKPSVAPKTSTDGFIMVYLPDGQSPVPVQNYFIVMVPLCKSHGGQLLTPLGSPEDMDLEELIQVISRLQRRSLRHSHQLEAHRPYIVARFSVLPPTFQPGDQKQYGGFDNRGLEPGHR
ncbi:Receptor-type tyrosine-protein phosphatase S [Myotis davidii]|uniref:Receptor-type tyrosine-protein phosphatase S n=1 Tax=Myotis davidii TaxID=225400 RepID=L5LZ42_MYODS|nr:Receptor-type tyrosine-protein phosphatase S [Myotis davidii]